ncbi:MAG: hypothetical protein CM15mP109_08230 [Candidatus Dadabacteria bacterium]|nr:MAG: hypothetical protein CM15mP109_08230 [Candidatus Dadabacteria bacterium]
MRRKRTKWVYDRVVDCVGSADAIQKCIELLKPQGKIIGLAVAWDDIQIPGIPAVNKEASYHTSRCYGLGPMVVILILQQKCFLILKSLYQNYNS